jgi:addiction module HigA family antidote
MKDIAPIHPGKILYEEFLTPLNLSQNALAKALKVPPRRINEIVLQKRSITADTALRLGKYFNISAEFWLNLQMKYELELAKDKIEQKLQEVEEFVA